MNHQVHHFDMGLWLLFLAYIVSVTGSVVGLACTRCGATATNGRDRLRWLLMASIAIGGVGIWLMHFIAMLGFAIPNSMVRYHLGWTVASAVIAIAAVFVGLITIGRTFDLRRLLAGGVITGLAVATMHYTGMWAVQMQGTMTYDTTLVVLSFVIAVVGLRPRCGSPSCSSRASSGSPPAWSWGLPWSECTTPGWRPCGSVSITRCRFPVGPKCSRSCSRSS